MVNAVTAQADRLYDGSDLSKTFSAAITAAEALALLYPMTGGQYTDADGFIYTLLSGNLVYSGSKSALLQRFPAPFVRPPAFRQGRLLLQRFVFLSVPHGSVRAEHPLRGG
jgi:hypothetical protein